ncbi:MAG: TetR/AcrR family transcriptional regulator [Acidobacteriota bacterium]
MTPGAAPRRRTPAPAGPSPLRHTRKGGPRRGVPPGLTRSAIFAAAADLFSRRGFDGVGVDGIARDAGVNKAMIYYHFTDKLALYREVVGEMLREAGARLSAIAGQSAEPVDKMSRFVGEFIALADARPYAPPLMLREIAEGAPHLDRATLGLMRAVFQAFGSILAEGQRRGQFRPVHPVLAYMTVLGPVLINAARERAAAEPGRQDLPMFVTVPHAELTQHMQGVALGMLSREHS